MNSKNPMPSFATVDDYISAQNEVVAAKLKELRAIIKEAAPDCEEVLNYKIPCFTLVPGGKRDQQLMMAGYAKFIGFYPFPTTMEAFNEELSSFKKGKGSVQFPLNEELPKELIVRMVRFRLAELKAKS